jgi:two-component system, response regulator
MTDGGTGVEILLVEDDAQDLELILRALQKSASSSRVEVARDGAEALDFVMGEGRFADRADKPAPKLILLDLMLPKLNGLEVLERVKRDPRTRHIPVVVLTSSQEQRDVSASYQLGVNSYVVKPMGFEQFVTAISNVGQYWLTINEPARAEGP